MLLLCAVLLLWRPLNFVFELGQALPTLGMRGAIGVIELVAHGAVAGLAVAAVRALWVEMSAGPLLAASALVASALTTVQSLYWSVLPHQTQPGDKLPLAILAVLHAAAWLLYLSRSRRIRRMT